MSSSFFIGTLIFGLFLQLILNTIWQEVLVTQLVHLDIFKAACADDIFVHKFGLLHAVQLLAEVMISCSATLAQVLEALDFFLFVDDAG